MNAVSPHRGADDSVFRLTWRLAPRKLLLALAVLAMTLVVAAAYQILTTPWLGVDFDAHSQPDGLSVRSVAADSPNADRLVSGVVLVAMAAPEGDRVALSGDLLMEEPDLLTYPAFNDFLRRQALIDAALSGGAASVLTADGRWIELRAIDPPLRVLLGHFLINVVYGLIAMLVALGIWVFRPGDRAAQLFALSGIAVFLCTLMLGVYGGRELALDATAFRLLSSFNHLGTLLTCAPLAGLFWVYPRPLGELPVPALLIAAAAVAWLLDLAQWGTGARDTVYLPVFIGYLIGLACAAGQWRATRGHPLDRASLKWCVLAIFSGSLLLMGLIMIPPVFGARPLVPLVMGFAAYLVLYLGIAAGLLRYRLFDIERWWFKTWLWFAGGMAVIGLDLFLVFGAGLAGSYALTLALAIAGWVYFPLRQWLWQRFGGPADVSAETALREMVDKLFSAATDTQVRRAWPALLQHTFTPLRLERQAAAVERVAVSADGVRLRVPELPGERASVVLEFPNNGGRLFSPEDVRVARLLYDLTGKALQAVGAREAGAEAERSRIMRDLHDDLGARLLSLVYAAENEANRELARAGLKDLHDLIDTTSGLPVSLGDTVGACEAEIRSRLTDAEIVLDWHAHSALPDKQLSARAAANISRILRESVSNIIRHADATRVAAIWRCPEPDRLTVVVSDDGKCPDPEHWHSGSGLRTMQVRAQDLGGRISWRRNVAGGCDLELSLPI